jgi:hypothetical protein
MTPQLVIFAVVTFAALLAMLDAARGGSEANRIRVFLRTMFPISTIGRAEIYVATYTEHQPGESEEAREFIEKREEIFEDLRAKVEAANDENIILALREVALARMKSEDDRAVSVIGRAQNLLSGIALFGVVLSFAGSLATLGHMPGKENWSMAAAILAGYVIINVVIMTFNVLRAAGGLAYSAAGNSDLARWATSADVLAFHRAHMLMSLDHLRHAKLNNDWRFAHLHLAQNGLRNIAYALSLLALTALVLNVAN